MVPAAGSPPPHLRNALDRVVSPAGGRVPHHIGGALQAQGWWVFGCLRWAGDAGRHCSSCEARLPAPAPVHSGTDARQTAQAQGAPRACPPAALSCPAAPAGCCQSTGTRPPPSATSVGSRDIRCVRSRVIWGVQRGAVNSRRQAAGGAGGPGDRRRGRPGRAAPSLLPPEWAPRLPPQGLPLEWLGPPSPHPRGP